MRYGLILNGMCNVVQYQRLVMFEVLMHIALIVAESYLIYCISNTTNRMNVNRREGKPIHPCFDLTKRVLTQLRQLKIRSDDVQGAVVPLSMTIMEGCFSP